MLKIGEYTISRIGTQKVDIAASDYIKPGLFDAEIEYIESTGSQWIDTEISGNAPHAQYSITASLTYTEGWWKHVYIGGQNNNTVPYLALFPGPEEYDLYVHQNPEIYESYIPVFGEKFTFTAMNGKAALSFSPKVLDYDETLAVWGDLTWRIFDSPWKQPDKLMSSMKLYSLRMLQDGYLLRDFVPVRKGDVGYLYDKVTGRLFENKGYDQFLLGPDKN